MLARGLKQSIDRRQRPVEKQADIQGRPGRLSDGSVAQCT